MADKLDLEKEANEVGKNADSQTFDFADDELEFEDQDDHTANREHQDGETADNNAAAKIADDELKLVADGSNAQQPPVPETATTTTTETTTQPETTEQIPPAAPTTTTTVAETAIAPAVTESVQPAASVASQTGTTEPPSQETIQKAYTDWKDESERLLAEHYYALSPETQAELELEPAKVIPRLMAKTYLDAMTASIGQMTMHFPRMVRLVLDQMETETKTEDAFFAAWPKLRGKEADVQRIGATWRQLNPHATQEQFINEVGAGTMIALRLDPSPAPAGGTTREQPSSFRPGLGAPPRGSVNPAGSDDNPFTRLNQEFEEDLDDESR